MLQTTDRHKLIKLSRRNLLTNKKTNIVLIGFMGSGKTTIGKLLEKSTGKKLVDIDKSIEQKTKTKIKKIFALYGEAHFRKLETLAVKVAAKKKNMIIATGGGVVKKQENINLLKNIAVFVHLMKFYSCIYRNEHLHQKDLKKYLN